MKTYDTEATATLFAVVGMVTIVIVSAVAGWLWPL